MRLFDGFPVLSCPEPFCLFCLLAWDGCIRGFGIRIPLEWIGCMNEWKPPLNPPPPPKKEKFTS
jgi:hypothetical protein